MIEKYDNGDWEEFEVFNQRKHGKAIYHWNENKVIWNYINGILQGKAVFYYKNGSKEECNYIDGKKQGKSTLYFKETREERNYIDGKLEGKSTLYKKGSIEERNYTGGVLQGKSIIWYLKTKDKEERNYVDGILQGRAIYYHKNGEKEEYGYINGKKNSRYLELFSKEKCNEIEDEYEDYYKNGKLKYRGTIYKKIINLKEINPFFDEQYINEITNVYENYDTNGNLINVVGYSNSSTNLISQYIKYQTGKIIYVKKFFKDRRETDYYENEKLKKMVLRKKINEEWEVYKTVYYDEQGNQKEDLCNIEEKEEEGFFERTFSKLGTNLSKKIKETDFREVLINLNNAIEKYKK